MSFATIFTTVLIMIGILMPGSEVPDVNIAGIDKIFHIGMFGVWAIAVRHDFKVRPGRLHTIFLAGLVFSLVTELAQLAVEGRSFDMFDMVADAAGLLTGLAVSGRLLSFLKKGKDEDEGTNV